MTLYLAHTRLQPVIFSRISYLYKAPEKCAKKTMTKRQAANPSQVPKRAADLPTAELPPKYRKGRV
jgi:hypothetical protein